MILADLTLCKRLERAEGNASAQFADARRRVFPGSGAEWIECAGAYAIFDTVDSPATQTFGFGLFEKATPAALDALERFFAVRGAHVDHEVSPLVGAATLELLCERNYRPFEITSVMYRAIEAPGAAPPSDLRVRMIEESEAALWGDISARGWSSEHPEYFDFLTATAAILTARKNSPCFIAEIDGKSAAAGALSIHEGVALFAGAATLPEFRRRGLQTALLHERLRYAFECGCDLAMMCAEPGGESQRNAQRRGFQIAYTRTKWRLKRRQTA
jgi:GNAT superfamily N-acetyltransferase